MSTPQTILVTGCAGFIGSNFVKQCQQKYPEIRIIGLDNLSAGRRDAISPTITFFEGSILDEAFVDSIFQTHSPSVIIHFAAIPRVAYCVEHPKETSETNILGTIVLLEAARKYHAKRLVLSSSSAVYGGADKLPTVESENFPHPLSPYAAQKFTDELFCKIYSNLHGLDTVCLRYFNVFGPGQYGDSAYSTVISAWLEALYFPKDTMPYLEGDGSQSRDFCYVDNVIQANLLAMNSERNLNGEAINIAHGHATTIQEVQRLLETQIGKTLDLEHRPPRLGDVAHTLADITKAKQILGYEPSVSFEEGLKRTIAWFDSRIQKA